MATTLFSNTIAITKAPRDGSSFTVVIESSNGNVFRPSSISTTLYCKVYDNFEDITDTLDAWRFNWKRTTADALSDVNWNNLDKARRKKSVTITSDDCVGRTVFECELDLDDL